MDCLLRILNDICKRYGHQFFFHSLLGIREVPVKNAMDVPAYRTFRIRLFMEVEESLLRIHAADSIINVIQCDLVKLPG